MKLQTSRFGEIEIDEEKALRFPQGIPGFEQYQQYVMVLPDEESPFAFMQSVDNGDLSFILTNPFVFYPDYDFELPVSVQDELGIRDEKDVMVYSVVTIPGEIEKATLNLLAPVVVNQRLRLGKQVILHDTEYRTKHALMTDAEEGAAGDAGTNT